MFVPLTNLMLDGITTPGISAMRLSRKLPVVRLVYPSFEGLNGELGPAMAGQRLNRANLSSLACSYVFALATLTLRSSSRRNLKESTNQVVG